MTPATSTHLHVRWMIRRDVPYVLDIEQDQLERECSSWFGFQWTEGDLIETMRKRDTIGMVVECLTTGRVLGYMVYRLHEGHFSLEHIATQAQDEDRLFDTLLGKLQSKLNGKRENISCLLPECNMHLIRHLQRNGYHIVSYGKKSPSDVWDMLFAFLHREDV